LAERCKEGDEARSLVALTFHLIHILRGDIAKKRRLLWDVPIFPHSLAKLALLRALRLKEDILQYIESQNGSATIHATHQTIKENECFIKILIHWV
jgi:hypothetical protein